MIVGCPCACQDKDGDCDLCGESWDQHPRDDRDARALLQEVLGSPGMGDNGMDGRHVPIDLVRRINAYLFGK